MGRKRKDGIKLSPEHGVNPTMGVCFFCREDNGEIALLGKLEGDAEAPKRMVLHYQPCDKCKEKFKDYVLCIEAIENPEITRMPIQGDLYPTGRWVCLKPENFTEPEKHPVGTVCLISKEICDRLFVGEK